MQGQGDQTPGVCDYIRRSWLVVGGRQQLPVPTRRRTALRNRSSGALRSRWRRPSVFGPRVSSTVGSIVDVRDSPDEDRAGYDALSLGRRSIQV